MPGTRKTLSRMQGTPPPTTKSRTEATSGTQWCSEQDGASPVASSMRPLAHIHVPDIPTDSNFIFEGLVFVYSVFCLVLQYINLYKTVWWLPHSHANYSLNFYLIDHYLVLFLVVIMSRRVVWTFVQEVFGGSSSKSCFYWLVQLFKLVLVLGMVAAFGWSSYHVVLKYSLLYCLFLCYPLVIYIVLFGVDMKPLFQKTLVNLSTSEKNGGTPKRRSSATKETIPTTPKDIRCRHTCSVSPEGIREEVDNLKTDFNHRIKQVLFNSMVSAYYMGLVPLCFAQNTLYYDSRWVTQHVCLVWITTFVLFMVHFLPAKYVDVLHRSSLHLGRWVKVEGRHHVPYIAEHAIAVVPPQMWSELQVWQNGALVKHVRGLFKAVGQNNAAEPGNGMHARFYFMFHLPLRVTNWLLIITLCLIFYQFVLLVQAIEWSHMLSLAFLLFYNYYVLFKLLRDRFVLSKAYKDELTQSQVQN